jgi:signal transduction histidine kinase
MIKVSVSDSGCGISELDQKNLFKMFGFLDATRDVNTKGIGLGLHICKLIAQQFGGEVSVSSELGKQHLYVFLLASQKQTLGSSASSDYKSNLIKITRRT